MQGEFLHPARKAKPWSQIRDLVASLSTCSAKTGAKDRSASAEGPKGPRHSQTFGLIARQSLAWLRASLTAHPASAEVVRLFTNLRFALRLGSTTLAFSVQPTVASFLQKLAPLRASLAAHPARKSKICSVEVGRFQRPTHPSTSFPKSMMRNPRKSMMSFLRRLEILISCPR